ncbi:hypothetical protein TNCV_1080391 [Trichonephila clavipes]|nr:hypothetical protein TNCV_1080391 [Trichonephila clavipes]
MTHPDIPIFYGYNAPSRRGKVAPFARVRPQRWGKKNTFHRIPFLIVRVQYFVRGGFVGHHSRASSKHLYSHLPVDGVRFLGGQKGLRCRCKMHVWVSGSPKISTAAGSGYVTALALYYRTFLLRKV